MSGQETSLTRKRRGPKPTGQGHVVGVRLHAEDLAAVDRWASEQTDKPSRPEAIRRIIRRGLRSE